jgi:hypothetical protein
MRSISAPLLLLFAAACSENSLDVGSDLGGSGGTGTGGSSTGGASASGGTGGDASGASGSSGVSTGGTATGGTPSTGGSSPGGSSPGGTTGCTDPVSFDGEWSGEILDSSSDPTESIQLSILADDAVAGGFRGTFTWGEGAPPQPATDANAPYPPGQSPESGVLPGAPWPGFPYTLVRGSACGSTIQLGVSTRELYDSWCSLQEPIDNGPLGFACHRLGVTSGFDQDSCWTMDEDGEKLGEYPLWRCGLCGGLIGPATACVCDASGCRANLEPTSVFELTMNAGGDVLTGPDSSCADCTVRLERVE